MNKVTRFLLLNFLLILFAGLFFGAGYLTSRGTLPLYHPAVPAELPSEFEILGEVWDVLSRDYVDKEALDPEKLSEGAVRGMLEALGDPYTSLLSAEGYQMAREKLHGEYEGIGAWVAKEEKQLKIMGIIEGSPAEEAGLKPGDNILEVDGVSTSELSLTEAVLRIRGKAGTPVKLLVLPQDGNEPVMKEIIRRRLEIPSVQGEKKEGVAYIKIIQFADNTAEELVSVLEQLLASPTQGIILDLRHNFGGVLAEVVRVASQFLEEGKVILYQVDSEGKEKVWKATADGLATDLPMVVLVNGASASGSEVLAGALQDHERASLIGTTTFGKGSVNFLRPLEDGSALYITTARWLTPDRREIEGVGLTPDFQVEMTEEDREQGKDTQLEFAIAYLKGEEPDIPGNL